MFRVSGFRVYGCRVLGFRVLGFRVWGLGFNVALPGPLRTSLLRVPYH